MGTQSAANFGAATPQQAPLEESGALANKKQQLRDRLISLRSTALIRYAPRVTKQIQKRWTTQGASARCRGAEVGDQRSQGPASCEGLRPRRLHTIEHAQVSQFIAAGMNILTISRRLGHASSSDIQPPVCQYRCPGGRDYGSYLRQGAN
jgi:hypothetical protein